MTKAYPKSDPYRDCCPGNLAGLPAPFVARLNAELTAMLAEPAVIERLRDIGSETRPTTPEGFRGRVANDVAKGTRVVAEAKIPKVG